MPEVLDLAKSIRLMTAAPKRSQHFSVDSRRSTYCPAMCVLDIRGNSRRRTLTYGVAMLVHVGIFCLFLVQLHPVVRIRALPEIALGAVSISAPAAPPAPIEKKIAPQISKLQKMVKQQEEQRSSIHELFKTTKTEAPAPSAFPLPQAAPTEAFSRAASFFAPLSGPISGPRGPSRMAQEASEAAAPRSEAAPPGNLSGGRATWEGGVLAQLARYRRYPLGSRLRHEQGVVYVRFRMNRVGKVLSSAVERSSGFASLDKEAIATLLRAQPLPPIPSDKPDELELSLPVEFLIR